MRLVKVYFSPTGGTKKIVDTVAEEFESNSIDIDLTDSKQNWDNYKFNKDDLVLIAVPSYGGRVPEAAIDRLKNLNGEEANAILIVSYGNRDYDDTIIELHDQVRESNFNPIAGIAAVAQHSLLPQFASGRPDREDLHDLKSFAQSIKNNNYTNSKELPGNRPYKKSSNLPLVPKVTKNCNECKKCYLLCPVDAIDFKTLKADKNKCITCMRCIKICPKNARKLNKGVLTLASLMLKKSATERKSNELFNFSNEI